MKEVFQRFTKTNKIGGSVDLGACGYEDDDCDNFLNVWMMKEFFLKNEIRFFKD